MSLNYWLSIGVFFPNPKTTVEAVVPTVYEALLNMLYRGGVLREGGGSDDVPTWENFTYLLLYTG